MARMRGKIALNATLAAVSTFVALLIFDRVLGLFGFPADAPLQIAHPPDFQEHRTNIEYAYHFATNSQGLRYPDVPRVKPDGTHRLYVAGDSYTEGFTVEANERYSALLERSFAAQQTAFVNGGLAGTGPLQYGRALLHIGLTYDLDGVLLAVYANDLVGTPPSATPEDLYRRTEQPGGFKRVLHVLWPRTFTLLKQWQDRREYRARTRPTDFTGAVARQAARQGLSAERIAAWRARLPDSLVAAIEAGTFNGSAFTYGLLHPDYWIDALDIASARAEAQWTAMEGLLSEIVARCRRAEVDVAVIFIPTRFQYEPRSHATWNPWIQAGCRVRRAWLTEDTAVQRRLAAWARAHDLPLLDLTPAFREAARLAPDLTWKLDGHWTPEGHRVAAEAIAAWLEEEAVFSFLKRRNAP